MQHAACSMLYAACRGSILTAVPVAGVAGSDLKHSAGLDEPKQRVQQRPHVLAAPGERVMLCSNWLYSTNWLYSNWGESD